MLFGAHVSSAGGIDNSPQRAADLGCEVFQTFTRSPQGGPAPKLTKEIVSKFKSEMKKYRLKEHYIHTPYYVNFASKNNKIRFDTINIVREELERGSLLGSKYVMTHLGSAKDAGQKNGLEMTIDGLIKVLNGYTGSTQLLIEIAAGSGEIMGDTFEELAAIIEGVNKKNGKQNDLNICFDTQHAFASGYDIRTPETIKATLNQFNNIVGIERLKLSHCNDSKVDIGKHVDRHTNLGEGKLGKQAFKFLVKESKLKNVNLVLETPRDEKGTEIKSEIQLLKKFRAK